VPIATDTVPVWTIWSYCELLSDKISSLQALWSPAVTMSLSASSPHRPADWCVFLRYCSVWSERSMQCAGLSRTEVYSLTCRCVFRGFGQCGERSHEQYRAGQICPGTSMQIIVAGLHEKRLERRTRTISRSRRFVHECLVFQLTQSPIGPIAPSTRCHYQQGEMSGRCRVFTGNDLIAEPRHCTPICLPFGEICKSKPKEFHRYDVTVSKFFSGRCARKWQCKF
jgi:hypothetical protein